MNNIHFSSPEGLFCVDVKLQSLNCRLLSFRINEGFFFVGIIHSKTWVFLSKLQRIYFISFPITNVSLGKYAIPFILIEWRFKNGKAEKIWARKTKYFSIKLRNTETTKLFSAMFLCVTFTGVICCEYKWRWRACLHSVCYCVC